MRPVRSRWATHPLGQIPAGADLDGGRLAGMSIRSGVLAVPGELVQIMRILQEQDTRTAAKVIHENRDPILTRLPYGGEPDRVVEAGQELYPFSLPTLSRSLVHGVPLLQ